MKLLILGGTGATGHQLIEQAVGQRHEVTVLVRSPEKLRISREVLDALTIIKGDVLDAHMLTKALLGRDAVISALGVGQSLKSSNLIEKATRNIIQAMYATKVHRIIFLSAFGVAESFAQANFIQRALYRLVLRNVFADKAKGEELLSRSNLDWTCVRPVVLTNGPFTGKYCVETGKMRGLPKISRADVAHFMLDQLHHHKFLKKAPAIVSGCRSESI